MVSPRAEGQGKLSTPVRLLQALFLILILVLNPGSIRAGSPDSPDSQPSEIAFLTVTVNESPRGEVPVVLVEGDALLPIARMPALGLAELVAMGTRRVVDGQQYVSLASLAPTVRFDIDKIELAIGLTVDPEKLASTTVDFRQKPPPELEYRDDPSMHINYAPRLIDGKSVDGYAEVGARAGGVLAWSALALRATGRLVRGPSYLKIDDRARMNQWVVGDSFASGGALGGGMHIGGITLSRNFDLDPYFVQGPSFGLAATAFTPSTLDVYVNGVLVRQVDVEPGPVRVENLPMRSGVGVASYVLRDVFGRTQAQASPYYISNGLLRPGVAEYTYSLGLARENLGLESFSYGPPVALARYRAGVSDSVTLGGRLETGNGVGSGGGTLTTVTDAGLLELAVGASGAQDRWAGVALASAWSYQARIVGLGASVRGMTNRYATISLSPADDRAVLEGNVFTSLSLHRKATIGARHSVAHYRDAGLAAQMGLLGTFHVAPETSLTASATRSAVGGARSSNELLLTLIVSLDRATTAQVSTRTRTGGSDEVIASVSRPRPRGEGTGLRAMAVYANDTLDRAEANAEVAGAHGVYAATYNLEPYRPGAATPRRHHLTLSTQGAIVFLPDAGVFATRPVHEAIGVVRVPGVRGVRGYLDNREVGRTNARGTLVVPDLLSYYANRLSIADEDLPLDYAIESTERLVAPAAKGAAIARFDARRVLYFRGKLTVRGQGQVIVPAHGELRVTDGSRELDSPIGSGGEFEFEGIAPGTYPARVVYVDGECTFRLRLPDAPGPVVELGTQRCLTP